MSFHSRESNPGPQFFSILYIGHSATIVADYCLKLPYCPVLVYNIKDEWPMTKCLKIANDYLFKIGSL